MEGTQQQSALNEPPITMRQLLEAGVHFGHQTKRWNPKMKPFIFGARNGIYIIDLQHTVKLFRKALQLHRRHGRRRASSVLFVGTKKQAQDVIQEEARRSGQFYVTNRWLGGTLTNFKTVKGSIERLRGIEKMAEDGTFERLTKKEVLGLERERVKLEKTLGGIKDMGGLPRRDVRHRPEEGAHRRRRGAQARDSDRRHRRHQLRSRTSSTTSSPATTTPSAPSSCSRARSPTPRIDRRSHRQGARGLAQRAPRPGRRAEAGDDPRVVGRRWPEGRDRVAPLGLDASGARSVGFAGRSG